MTKRKRYLSRMLAILLSLVLGSLPSLAATPGPAGRSGEGSGPPPAVTVAPSPGYDDYARFLAGLGHPEGSLAAYESRPAWVRYAKAIGQDWESFENGRLGPMREWASRELGAAGGTTVFYPFSGPDFINVYTLFPHARTYLMVALEPPGVLPDPDAATAGDYFASLQRSLYEYLHIDFFGTARMKSQISDTALKGVLPVLLAFLAREQARVLEVHHWLMQPDGTVVEQPALGATEDLGHGIPGLRIVFEGPGSTGKQTLYYFQFNLQNSSFGRNQQFVDFIKKFGPLTTFTKAASYLLHSPNSSDIRQFILERSRYVVQGDSGIPLKYFAPPLWNLKLYGTYTSPLALFKNRFQADLAAADRKSVV